ncbi:hypothetical protein MHBO_002229 [Bonamia ostreae]|uniref:Uncharacterized protein n=1 Tax=Bonamia ostreae TaxID=126728 RepID=A0ABV2AMN7_9EUKA
MDSLKISKEDFYKKSTEFRVWLFEQKGMYFDEQKSKKLKKLFKRFAKKWNKGKLSQKYYEGINSSAVEVPATRHQWNFDLSTRDKNTLEKIKDRVDTETYHTKTENTRKERPKIANELPMQTEAERANKRLENNILQRRERERFREEREELRDNIMPRPEKGTREAMIEKKKIKREKNRTRDEQMPALNDKFLMGSSKDDYKNMLNRKRVRQERKNIEQFERVKKHRQAEREKIEYFKQLLQKK